MYTFTMHGGMELRKAFFANRQEVAGQIGSSQHACSLSEKNSVGA
jgi:hypothetical protein